MYDSLSFQSRKNPKAVIASFKQAFNENDLSVGLVVKVNNAKMLENEINELEKLKGNYINIYFITDTLSRIEINGLISCCDVAVSLHRSEGLGLLCQEAMYFGKPVIATNWSGNVDFMDNETACMVDYSLVPIGNDIGPYKANQRWAEADVSHASMYMCKLKEDKEFYHKIGGNAQKYIQSYYSAKHCSKRMKDRIEFIMKSNKIVTEEGY